jgi:sortase (surface protein transpeptidase)
LTFKFLIYFGGDMLFDERNLESLFNSPPKAKKKLTFLKQKSSETWWPDPNDSPSAKTPAQNTANPQTPLTREENEAITIVPTGHNRSINKLVLIFGIIILFLVIINGPALFQNFKWWYITDYQNQAITSPVVPTALAHTDTLTINKLGVAAPIIWDSTAENRSEAMTQGVVSLNPDTRPGNGSTVTLVGHANDYWWHDNRFGQIFTLLNHMVVGDKININYHGHDYQYLVTNILSETPAPELLTGDDTLVLVTSQFTSSKKRLFLVARLANKNSL